MGRTGGAGAQAQGRLGELGENLGAQDGAERLEETQKRFGQRGAGKGARAKGPKWSLRGLCLGRRELPLAPLGPQGLCSSSLDSLWTATHLSPPTPFFLFPPYLNSQGLGKHPLMRLEESPLVGCGRTAQQAAAPDKQEKLGGAGGYAKWEQNSGALRDKYGLTQDCKPWTGHQKQDSTSCILKSNMRSRQPKPFPNLASTPRITKQHNDPLQSS